MPRYTSYPTVPYWKESIPPEHWAANFKQQFALYNEKGGISLYIHLPFCESLCTYCGCNKRITTNHRVEIKYLLALKSEWQLYTDLMGQKPMLRELHLGGGTPTFFSPENLEGLLTHLYAAAEIPPDHEFSFEGHPNNTTPDHLQTLYDLGFRRVSYGVQDNAPEVQRIINRIQPLENVKRAAEQAREIGYSSVNFDLIYGLPGQTPESMEKTLQEIIALKPDRVAFYSYAHVPWTSKGQRLFDEGDLPDAELKLKLYLLGKQMFTENGYTDIGMDHFALPTDDLYKTWKRGQLHRNFMGYTMQNTPLLLGLGVSAISDTGNAFVQNNKILQEYYNAVLNQKLPVQRGYFLNDEDVAFRKYILDLSCRGKTTFNENDRPFLEEYTFAQLEELAYDGLISWNENGIEITELGRNFVRNICRAFDLHLLRNAKHQVFFSKAI